MMKKMQYIYIILMKDVKKITSFLQVAQLFFKWRIWGLEKTQDLPYACRRAAVPKSHKPSGLKQ